MGYDQENDFNFDFDTQQPSHHSYKQYQRKVGKKKNESMAIFVSAFFIMLFVFLGLAKQLSPDIDVSIGNDETTSETEGIIRGNVDDRLKSLQMEDNGLQAGDDELFDTTLDEKVVLPKDKHNKEVQEEIIEDETVAKPAEKKTEAVKDVKPQPSPAAKDQTTPKASNTAKVVVGYYSTLEQAEVAKGILKEAGLNVTPFIRNIGGAYTIQTGSFSTRESAQAAASELLRNNFPARVIVE